MGRALTSEETGSGPAPDLTIVIVNWNAGELLRRCLDSIRRHPPSAMTYETIVVDNASTDDSLSAAEPLADRVVRNTENAGFARANNLVLSSCRSPLVFLLNPDAEVTSGAIDVLANTLRSHPRAGACGPRLVHPDGTLQPSAWHTPPAAWRTLVSGLGLWRAIPRRARGPLLLGDHWAHDEKREVPMIFGAAMLVRRETVDDVGPLDDRFPLYAEDEEWCLRMRRHGWSVVFEPAATVIHHGNVSTLQRWDAVERLLMLQEALHLLQRVTVSRPRRIANFTAQCVVSAAQMLRHPASPAPRALLRAHLRMLGQELRER